MATCSEQITDLQQLAHPMLIEYDEVWLSQDECMLYNDECRYVSTVAILAQGTSLALASQQAYCSLTPAKCMVYTEASCLSADEVQHKLNSAVASHGVLSQAGA